MPYQEHGMWEVLEVLRRTHGGETRRSIARSTGRSRSTVDRYIALAKELGWVPGLEAPDEQLASRVAVGLRPGPGGGDSRSQRLLLAHIDQIKEWLAIQEPAKRGLTLTKVHALLARRSVDVSYSALYRFAVKHLDFGRTATTVRMADCEPGELAEVDFGMLGMVFDPERGRNRRLHALVVTLVFSRHQYVYTTFSQRIADVVEGLEQAWEFFGGCPRRVVIDNLKPAVTKADRYDPVFQRTFEEYARYRGFVIDACVVREPRGKPHVERQVPYVRENFFRGEQFIDRDHVQREAVRWCEQTAGMRVHGTTRKQPLVQFNAYEKAALIALASSEHFDTPRWATPTVHPDCHVRFNNALYSVPFKYKGRKVTVRGDRSLVRIFVGGQLVKVHATQSKGARSTDFTDYPAEKSDYAMRDADRIIARAAGYGPSVSRFADKLLSGNFPWAKLRQAQKLIRLAQKYGARRTEAACQRALGFDLVNVRRLQTILERALDAEAVAPPPSEQPAADRVVQLPLRFARPAQSFTHDQQEEDKDRGR